MDTGWNLYVLMEHLLEPDLETYNPNQLPSRIVIQLQNSFNTISGAPVFLIVKAGITGRLFCRIARGLPEDENRGWAFHSVKIALLGLLRV